MTELIVATRFRASDTTLCSVTAAFDGGNPVDPDSVLVAESFFTMPAGTTYFELIVQTLTSDAFSSSGTFSDDGAGGFTPNEALGAFEPPVTASFVGDTAYYVVAHLPELRDATDDSVTSLTPPPGRVGVSPPSPITSWDSAPDLFNASVISTPCLVGSTLQVTASSLTASGEMVVFERTVADAPTRVAVYWPTAVSRNPGAMATPFLYYLHPTYAQNAIANPQDPSSPYYVNSGDNHDPVTNSTYPNGYDYNYFGLWRYLHYSDATSGGAWAGDPVLQDPFWKGLPYQIDASGKPVVAVLAMNKVAGSPCDEVKSLTEAAEMQQLLFDIQAVMFRRAGNFTPPGIGRLAMASFSSGHTTLSCCLSKTSNHSHALYTDTLQEIYLFDPHADLASELTAPVANTLTWLASGPLAFPPTKVARLYTQITPPNLTPVLAQFGMPTPNGPFDLPAPANSNISVTCLPLATWNAVAPSIYQHTGDVHQVMSAAMLTDALVRSSF
jgi:hypothetical protein